MKRAAGNRLTLVLTLLFLGVRDPASAGAAEAPSDPVWIWSGTDAAQAPGTRWFRLPFRTPPYTWNARLTLAADDDAEVFLNGRPVAVCRGPSQPVRAEVSMNLNQGDNLLAVRARNASGRAGLLLRLNLGGAESRQVVSGPHWLTATEELPGWNLPETPSAGWKPAVQVATYADSPWGPVLDHGSATAASELRVLPGFTAELLRSAEPGEGSWVCMAFDPVGRLYLSPEGDTHSLLRLRFGEDGSVTKVEKVPAPVRFAMGLLAAHGSLYANAKGPAGTGLYRLTDTNGNDRYDPGEEHLLKTFRGSGEHGYHALALGPDGWIHVLNGNGTKPPEGLSPNSPYRHWGEDVLSPNPDETHRAGGALAPGCQVLRTDPDGKTWELVAGGMRNAYGFDFNPDGELFVFDSDNEWDWGTPWYRATRVYHCVSGAEMGWRDGTRAWPDHYPDMIGSVVDIGLGSPCGVRFGTPGRFPEKFRRALLLQDWSYGRILALHLEPHGASYRGTGFEELVKGQPLNLTSMTFGPDGALYFVTGGRGTQSGLYRLRYTGPLDDSIGKPLPNLPDPGAPLRALRRGLEAFHRAPQAAAIPTAWPHLAHADRAIRYAARLALEAQPLDAWSDRALSETRPTPGLHALLALARTGTPDLQPALIKALGRFPLATLDEEHRLLKLRIIELSFLRQGRPSPELLDLAVGKLSPRYPAASWAENRELCRLLLWLGAPGAISRTLDLLEQAPQQEHQIHYVSQLRNLREGWSTRDRERFLGWWLQPRDHLQRPGSLLHWFHDVGRTYVDGANLDRHLEGFRRDAVATLSDAERDRFRQLLEGPIAGAVLLPARPRAFVRDWTLEELLPALEEAGAGRNFSRGRQAFIDTQCYACHRLGNTGAAIGPELGGIASKYTRRDLLESLLLPSKVISDQYQNQRVFLKDGEDVTGRLVRESATELVIETDPLTRTQQTIPRSEVDEIRPSTVSPMPEGLLQVLTREEILDLLAFLESGGDPEAPAFRKP